MAQDNKSIADSVNNAYDNTVKYPTIVKVKRKVMDSDVLGLWLRFKDGTYHNSEYPNAKFPYAVLSERIKNGAADVLSCAPLSKETLLAAFSGPEFKSKRNKINYLYSKPYELRTPHNNKETN